VQEIPSFSRCSTATGCTASAPASACRDIGDVAANVGYEITIPPLLVVRGPVWGSHMPVQSQVGVVRLKATGNRGSA
jgi:hypothetical protein